MWARTFVGVVSLVLAGAGAGCSPSLEGAPCTSDRNCPESQTCVENACRTRCHLSCGDGMVCGFRSGGPGCECPEPEEPVFYADSIEGTAAGEAPFPTGAPSPASCRFKTVSDALAAARAQVDSGQGAAEAVAFSADTTPRRYETERFPLEVPAGVTLRAGAENADPARHVLVFKGNGDAVRLGGGTFAGFTLSNESTVAPVNGIAVQCQNATATLRDLLVIGSFGAKVPLLRGILVDGCGLQAQNVKVSDAPVGLEVANTTGVQWSGGEFTRDTVGVKLASAAGTGVELSGTKLSSGGEGIVVSAGAVTLKDVESSKMGGAGLSVSGGTVTGVNLELAENATGAHVSGDGVLALSTSDLSANTQEGVRIDSASARVDATGCTLHQNGKFAAKVEGGQFNWTGGSAIGGGSVGLDVSGGGKATLTGDATTPLVIAEHPSSGLRVSNGSVVASFVELRGNAESVIQNTDGIARELRFTDCTFTAGTNEASVLRVAQAQLTTLERATFIGGATGLSIGPGAVELQLKDSLLRGAKVTGVAVTGNAASQLTFTGNQITQNGDGSSDSSGGLVLQGTPPTAPLVFDANRIFGNNLHQIAVTGGDWALNGSCGDAKTNEVTCYSAAGYGVFAASGASVNVGAISWTTPGVLPAPSTAAHDYSGSVTGTLTTCGAVTTTCQ